MRFLAKVLLTTAVLCLAAIYPVLKYGSPEMYPGLAAGVVLSLLNFLIGYFSVEYAFEKPDETFLKVVLGGMAARLLATAGAVFVLIFLLDFHVVSLVSSLFFFYTLFLIFEIMHYNKKAVVKRQTSASGRSIS